ncbi:hypothetical protein [Parasulfitobacter algicola]|uniref:Uncharacterized protein n=1 Tax=Parasulfitobacter algicola TaxID=2614809 RepID=A0ABX2IP31_9RHOB|nr:hypothetical protein [Sulfitobacter algicola]NSX54649.1 hypothetical protein [Sulfitobacter algicola]
MMLCAPCFAGPSGQVWIEEDIIAVNDTHIFIMRDIQDNLAFHNVLRTDTFLVSKDIQTGLDDQIWPVRIVVYYGRDTDTGNEGRLTETEPMGRVDPYVVLIENFARPTTFRLKGYSFTNQKTLAMENGNLGFVLTYVGTEYRIRFQDVQAQVSSNMTKIYDFMVQRDPELAYMLPLGGLVELEDIQPNIDEECKIVDRFKEQGTKRAWAFLQLNCEREESFGLSVWVAVPPAQ